MENEDVKRVIILERESLEMTDWKGEITVAEGPCAITVAKSKIQRLRKFTSHAQSKYISVQYTDGRTFHIRHASYQVSELTSGHLDFHIFLRDGESSHNVRAYQGSLRIEPEGSVTFMKLHDGCFVKYKKVPKGAWPSNFHRGNSNSIPHPISNKSFGSNSTVGTGGAGAKEASLGEEVRRAQPSQKSGQDENLLHSSSDSFNLKDSKGLDRGGFPYQNESSQLPPSHLFQTKNDLSSTIPTGHSVPVGAPGVFSYCRDMTMNAVRNASSMGFSLFDGQGPAQESKARYVDEAASMEKEGDEEVTFHAGEPHARRGHHQHSSSLAYHPMDTSAAVSQTDSPKSSAGMSISDGGEGEFSPSSISTQSSSGRTNVVFPPMYAPAPSGSGISSSSLVDSTAALPSGEQLTGATRQANPSSLPMKKMLMQRYATPTVPWSYYSSIGKARLREESQCQSHGPSQSGSQPRDWKRKKSFAGDTASQRFHSPPHSSQLQLPSHPSQRISSNSAANPNQPPGPGSHRGSSRQDIIDFSNN